MPIGPDEARIISAAAKGAAQAALEPLHDLIRDLAGPSFRELGDTWRDQLRVWRLQRAARLAIRVKEILAPLGIETRAVPLKLLIPAIEYASLEDNDDLQDRWAALLSHAADPSYDGTILPVFADILHQVAPQDAVFLDRCREFLIRKAEQRHSFGQAYLYELGTKPELLLMYAGQRSFRDVSLDVEEQFDISLANLSRLALLSRESFPDPGVPHKNALELDPEELAELRKDPVTISHYFMTPFGFTFTTACRPRA